MINSKKELNRVHKLERNIYLPGTGSLRAFRLKISCEQSYLLWRYTYELRKCEYYKNTMNDFPFNAILLVLSRRKKNILGQKLGIEIHENCFEEGLTLYHGNIVVNSDSKIGKNCKLHGMNCIGNKGDNQKSPIIGDDVELGVGAHVLGAIKVANEAKIAANAVMIKDAEVSGVYTGIPAELKSSKTISK